jgi:hypothetical protein
MDRASAEADRLERQATRSDARLIQHHSGDSAWVGRAFGENSSMAQHHLFVQEIILRQLT